MGLLPQNTENKNKFLKKREAWFYILYCENVFTKGQNAGDPMLQVVPPGVAEGFLCTTEVAEKELWPWATVHASSALLNPRPLLPEMNVLRLFLIHWSLCNISLASPKILPLC